MHPRGVLIKPRETTRTLSVGRGGEKVEVGRPWRCGVWNLMAPWMVEITIPIFCIDVLPSNILYGESDLTMNKLRVSFLARGGSPIVISRGIYPLDQDFSLENPIRGTFESILDALMEGNVISLPPEMKSSDALSLV
ncbi:hypothetical protein Tco_0215620 [Tanacetum coccineum]